MQPQTTPSIITTVLDWGRVHGSKVDQSGQFTHQQTEALRRTLRDLYLNGTPTITGDWRKGYELMIGSERVGVTNGYGPFRVYYRNNSQTSVEAPIPFDGVSPDSGDDLTDDYAIEAWI
jgi:hypothetical protein